MIGAFVTGFGFCTGGRRVAVVELCAAAAAAVVVDAVDAVVVVVVVVAAAAAVVVVAVVAVDSPHDPSRVSSSVSQRPSLSSGVVVGSRSPLTVSSNSRRQRVS